jgi:hypothetical protein
MRLKPYKVKLISIISISILFIFGFINSAFINAQVIIPDLESLDNIEEPAETSEVNCELILQNIQFRMDYYSVNTDSIISKYTELHLKLGNLIEILKLMNIDYQNIEDNETKLERDIEDIENLKDNLLDSLTEAKEINCESETRLRRSIRESKLALADLKQKITETNNYIIFNTISNIRKLSREVE